MNYLVKSQSKQEVSNSLIILFDEYNKKKKSILEISNFVKNKSEVVNHFLNGNKISHAYATTLFDENGALKSLNAEYWSEAMKMTDVLSCMPAAKRNEWNNMIYELKTPDFNQESVISTLYDLLLNRNSFLADKVDGIFQKLSGNHATNSPMGFKQRMIIDYLISSYGSLTDRLEYINDLRSVIAKLMKRDEPKTGMYHILYDIIKEEKFGEWFSFDGGSFKIRLYKKGTAHLEIHDSMSLELNQILAQKYPSIIPESNKGKKKSKQLKEIPLEMNLLRFETCNILSQIADNVKRGKGFSLSYYEIKDSKILEEVNSVLDYLNVDRSNLKYFIFNYDAYPVLMEIVRLGSLPNKKSHQFYPTEEFLSNRVVSMLDIEPSDSILEPSAGLGGIAKNLPKKQTTCVEISSIHCESLKTMGFKEVVCIDFLKYNGKKFNKIVMNPPFNKGQAEAHLKHAISLLNNEGRLVAILPASLKGKIFTEKGNHSYSEVLSGQFEEVQVNVVILELNFL